MPSTSPAMKGVLGSTEYYIVTMKAKEVAEKMKAAVEVEGWDDLSIEQKYQREINLNRVRRDIAPYLASDKDRFFGALIVAVQNCDKLDYEPVKQIVKSASAFTGSHKAAADGLGFLTFDGSEVFIPIDGQHRAKAIDFAIRGKDDRDQELEFESDATLGKDDVTLILIQFDTEEEKRKGRKIFSKVNRYAKKPTKAETLIIDDDDIHAVFARRLTESESGLFTADVVAFKGDALPVNAKEFTTLNTIYEINKQILKYKNHNVSTTEIPSKRQQLLYWNEVESAWQDLIQNLDHFSHALKDTSDEGNEVRKEIRSTYLLGKPIGQRVVAHAFLELTEFGELKPKEACKRLNDINWRIDDKMWENVLTRDRTRVLFGGPVRLLGKDFVTYLAGRPLTDEEIETLKTRISPDNNKYRLPDRVADELPDWKDALA